MADEFLINSGERQIGTTLKDIRKDHTNRYDKIAEIMKPHNPKRGLDCFCGNGYGTSILTNELKECYVLGIDASQGAIDQANKYYSNWYTEYKCDIYPFSVDDKYDFIASIESVEHVENSEQFVKDMFDLLVPGGHLFISTPNEDKIPHHLNTNPFHYRHFTIKDVSMLISSIDGARVQSFYGQDVYKVDSSRVIKGLLPNSEMGLKRAYYGQFLFFEIVKDQ